MQSKSLPRISVARPPHDGLNTNNISGKTYEQHWREAGFMARTVPNQGSGAAKQRIEAVRRLFPQMWFNEETTADGRLALGWYHPKISDDERRRDELRPDNGRRGPRGDERRCG